MMSIFEDYDNYHFPGLEERNKKHPRIGYINMRLPMDTDILLWAKNFKKAFKLLDQKNEYNIIILLKADNCTTDEKSVLIQNMKKIVIIDK